MAFRISTKGRYGLRALVDLALNATGKPVFLADIARRQDLSKRYLERLFTQLRARGIIRSVRGASGGYVLGRRPEEIRVSEIIETLEGPIRPAACVDGGDECRRIHQCVTHALWCDLAAAVYERLDGLTLEDLRRKQAEAAGAQTQMYYI